MKASRGLAVFIICVVVVAGVAITWRLVEAKAAERKLAEDAKACRVRAEGGDAKAQYELGGVYYRGKGVAQDYVEALRWYRKAADQGSAKGQYAVGFMYDGGKGVPQDFAQAIAWYRKSADQGDARAQCALGYTYSLGKGVPKDYATAVEWYRKAADQGNAEAQSELGYMYAEGKGVPQDYSQAVGWYRKAADQGYARGQDGVGYAYFKGAGVPRNYAEAARWYRKAAKQGDEYGRRALGSMNAPFSATREITLSVMFVFCLVLLASSRGGLRTRQQRRTTLPGLLGLTRVGLDLYGYFHFGILLALSAVNVFYFGKSLLGGVIVAMLVPIIRADGVRIVFGMCGILFVGFNIYAIAHYDLRYLPSSQRVFYSANGLLIGAAIASVMLLWLDRERTGGSQNDGDAVAYRTIGDARQ
jgi:TPR repeat protein